MAYTGVEQWSGEPGYALILMITAVAIGLVGSAALDYFKERRRKDPPR